MHCIDLVIPRGEQIALCDSSSNILLILNVGHGYLINDMGPKGVHALCVRILGPQPLTPLPSFIVIGSCTCLFYGKMASRGAKKCSYQ